MQNLLIFEADLSGHGQRFGNKDSLIS